MSARPAGSSPEAAAQPLAVRDDASEAAVRRAPLDCAGGLGHARSAAEVSIGGGNSGASTARSLRLQTARPWSGSRITGDGAMMGVVRKQMEAFEERVHSQLAHLREQQQHSRLREATLSRIEEKVATSERAQPKLDRRLAELTGNFTGLSDEIQAQIRRLDQTDERFHSWRRQLEEELRQRFVDFEQRLQQASSGSRVLDVSVQEGQRRMGQRLARLESEVAERIALQDEAHDGLESVWERLSALENQHLDLQTAIDNAISRNGAGSGSGDEALALLDGRLADMAGRLEGALSEAQEAHAKVAQQEQQQKALRTLVETREDHLREWDSKMRQVELLPDCQQRLGSGGEASGGDQALEECRQQLQKLEARLGVLEVELESPRADSDLTVRTASLVTQLRELVPRVVQHDREIEELRAGGGGVCSEDLLKSHSILIDEHTERVEQAFEDAAAARRDLERLTELSDNIKRMADGLVSDLDGLKGDIASLATSIVRREEFIEVTGQVNKLAASNEKAVSEVKQELATQTGLSNDSQEKCNSLSRDLADLRNEFRESLAIGKDMVKRYAFQDMLGSVQQDIDALSQRLQTHVVQEGPSKEDLAAVVERVEEHAELLAEQARLTRQATAEASEARQSAERLAVRWSADGAAGHLANLQSDLAAAPEAPNTSMDKTALFSTLDTRLDALGSKACTNGDAKHQLQQRQRHQSLIMDTARRVLEDHENESQAHDKVLSCIDDLCARLAALDSAVVAEEGARPAADLEHRFEALASRVAEMQKLERQLQLQVEGFAAEARLARSVAAPADQTVPDVVVSTELCKLADADAGGGCN